MEAEVREGDSVGVDLRLPVHVTAGEVAYVDPSTLPEAWFISMRRFLVGATRPYVTNCPEATFPWDYERWLKSLLGRPLVWD